MKEMPYPCSKLWNKYSLIGIVRSKLIAIPWTIAQQDPLSMEFSMQELVAIPFSSVSSLTKELNRSLLHFRQIIYHLRLLLIWIQSLLRNKRTESVNGTQNIITITNKSRLDQNMIHFSSVLSDSLQPHESHHARPPCVFTQTHIHRVGNAIQPSHPLLSPSPPARNSSQHQGLFQWVSSLQEVAKVLEFQLQHQSFQWTPRTDLL